MVRLIKSYQGMLRNIYLVGIVFFILSAGVYATVSGIINLTQINALNILTVSGLIALGGLVGGVIEFD